jgi:hypothetical protein
LDLWPSEQALRDEQARVSATTVWSRRRAPSGQLLLGLAHVGTARRAAVAEQGRRLQRGTLGYLLGRLALDQTLQGKRLGGQLLLDALGLIVGAAERSRGRGRGRPGRVSIRHADVELFFAATDLAHGFPYLL